MKKILSLLLILLMASPLMAADKKAKAIKGKVISITAEAIKIKVKKEEKEFKIDEKTKITDKEGNSVAAADAKFAMAMVKASKADPSIAGQIKEFAGKAPKGKKEKKAE